MAAGSESDSITQVPITQVDNIEVLKRKLIARDLLIAALLRDLQHLRTRVDAL